MRKRNRPSTRAQTPLCYIALTPKSRPKEGTPDSSAFATSSVHVGNVAAFIRPLRALHDVSGSWPRQPKSWDRQA